MLKILGSGRQKFLRQLLVQLLHVPVVPVEYQLYDQVVSRWIPDRDVLVTDVTDLRGRERVLRSVLGVSVEHETRPAHFDARLENVAAHLGRVDTHGQIVPSAQPVRRLVQVTVVQPVYQVCVYVVGGAQGQRTQPLSCKRQLSRERPGFKENCPDN